jgi:hypothetical protein
MSSSTHLSVGPPEVVEDVEDVEQKSRREDVLNQILLLLNTAIGRRTKRA